ncbi:MAG: hypothetical protein WBJ54_09885, partial [Syntrophorhabdus sp.]
MNYFDYKNEELFGESVPVAQIAQEVGTPVYIYSYKTLERHYRVFDSAFNRVPHLTCYSCKANSNIAILRVMGFLGGGADIVSGGELYRALRAGIQPQRIVFSGVGKTEEEIISAVKVGILMINVESAEELSVIQRVAKNMRKKIP